MICRRVTQGDKPKPATPGRRQGDVMAMILDFRSRTDTRPEAQADQSGPRQTHEAPAGAQIIIFPGVRRERHDEAPKPQRRRRAPKRDRLELPD